MGTEDAAEVLKSGVYRIDLGGGWFYVGSACDLRRRERQHRSKIKRGDHYNKIMQNVFNKYGVFIFTVIASYETDEILRHEQELLDQYCGDPKCANVAPTAGNSLGVKHSDATKSKLSAYQLGREKTPEHRAAIGAAHKGLIRPPRTPEWSAAQSAAHKGKKRPAFSAEWRANMSAAFTGRKVSDETRAKQSVASTGRKMPPRTPEWRAKQSVAQRAVQTGRTHSEETKKKMSDAAIARWARLREAAAAAL